MSVSFVSRFFHCQHFHWKLMSSPFHKRSMIAAVTQIQPLTPLWKIKCKTFSICLQQNFFFCIENIVTNFRLVGAVCVCHFGGFCRTCQFNQLNDVQNYVQECERYWKWWCTAALVLWAWMESSRMLDIRRNCCNFFLCWLSRWSFSLSRYFIVPKRQ